MSAAKSSGPGPSPGPKSNRYEAAAVSAPSIACGSPPPTLICTLRGLGCAGLGTLTSSTPFLNVAFTVSGSTPSGKPKERRKVPKLRSTR
jgi:hypothetical protein